MPEYNPRKINPNDAFIPPIAPVRELETPHHRFHQLEAGIHQDRPLWWRQIPRLGVRERIRRRFRTSSRELINRSAFHMGGSSQGIVPFRTKDPRFRRLRSGEQGGIRMRRQSPIRRDSQRRLLPLAKPDVVRRVRYHRLLGFYRILKVLRGYLFSGELESIQNGDEAHRIRRLRDRCVGSEVALRR